MVGVRGVCGVRGPGKPVRDATFTRAFFEVRDALSAAATAAAADLGPAATATEPVTSAGVGEQAEVKLCELDQIHAMSPADCEAELRGLGNEALPGYFKLLTLLGLWIFGACEDVDVVIMEVGVGGRYDATNVLGCALPSPPIAAEAAQGWEESGQTGGAGDASPSWSLGVVVATGVTTLDLDHTQTLGSTLGEIAFEKGTCSCQSPEPLRTIPCESSLVNHGNHVKFVNHVRFVKSVELESRGLVGGAY